MACLWWPCYDTLVYDFTLSSRGIIDSTCRFLEFICIAYGGLSENLDTCHVLTNFDASRVLNCNWVCFWFEACPPFDVICSAAKIYFVLYFVKVSCMARIAGYVFGKPKCLHGNHDPCLACRQRFWRWSFRRDFVARLLMPLLMMVYCLLILLVR